LTPSASSGIAASEKVNRSDIHRSYPPATLLRLSPSLRRPIWNWLEISGAATESIVSRILHFHVAQSYMRPVCQLIGRSVRSRPNSRKRESRSLPCGSALK
jgi:hypothetical protein